MTATNPRRVLMTADTVGGVWTYALELCAALAAERVQVTLATMGAPLSADQARAAASVPDLEVCESGYALEWMPEPWAEVDAAGDWLLALAAERRPDVVHINGFAHAALPFAAPVVAVGHSCVCSWWRAVKGEEAPPSWDHYRRRVGAGLRAADAVVAPTAAILDEILTSYSLSLPSARVIPNARNPAGFAVRPKAPFVMTAGRLWDPAKNLAAVEQAAAGLPWPVYVAGATDSPDGDRVEVRASIPLGRLSAIELSAWMGRAAIYALPARYEPFGLSVLEAALSGCALVLGDIPSLREVWGSAATWVDPDDPDALRTALARCIDRPGERRQMAARARMRAARFAPRAMAAAYRALYDQLADPGSVREGAA